MARTHERVFALVAAVVFLGTSVAFSLAVIWQIKNDKKNNTQQQVDTSKVQEGKLEGTKLTGFTPLQTVDKLEVVDLKEGTGDVVKDTSSVTAHYTGALVKDGTIFQSSKDTGQPFTSKLSGLIKGWQQGIPGMKAGGTRRLIIPADLAYGAQAQQGIPANSPLVFDIELLSVQQ